MNKLCLMVSVLLLAACAAESDLAQGGVGEAVIVYPSQSGQVIEVHVGQIISIPLKSPEMNWQADYESSIIQLVSDAGEKSGDWRFKAVAAGETLLMFSSQPAVGGMAPPSMMRVEYTIKVIR